MSGYAHTLRTANIIHLTSFSKSSADMPYSFASANRFDVLGSEIPFSHFETACRLTPMVSATNSCVILHLFLCSFKTSPIDFIITNFSFRTSLDLMYFNNARTTRMMKTINKIANITHSTVRNTIGDFSLGPIISSLSLLLLYKKSTVTTTNYGAIISCIMVAF